MVVYMELKRVVVYECLYLYFMHVVVYGVKSGGVCMGLKSPPHMVFCLDLSIHVPSA